MIEKVKYAKILNENGRTKVFKLKELPIVLSDINNPLYFKNAEINIHDGVLHFSGERIFFKREEIIDKIIEHYNGDINWWNYKLRRLGFKIRRGFWDNYIKVPISMIPSFKSHWPDFRVDWNEFGPDDGLYWFYIPSSPWQDNDKGCTITKTEQQTFKVSNFYIK